MGKEGVHQRSSRASPRTSSMSTNRVVGNTWYTSAGLLSLLVTHQSLAGCLLTGSCGLFPRDPWEQRRPAVQGPVSRPRSEGCRLPLWESLANIFPLRTNNANQFTRKCYLNTCHLCPCCCPEGSRPAASTKQQLEVQREPTEDDAFHGRWSVWR